MRKELYQPLSSYDINDFVIPLKIIKQGFRVILEEKAFCFEKTASDYKGEFSRQVRITNRTLRALFNHKQLLNPFRFPVISFEIVSHKFFKFLTPCFLIILLFANILLAPYGVFYLLFLVCQFLFYSIASYSYFSGQSSQNKLISLCYSFVVVTIAYLMGWIKYLSGETFSTWQPERNS